MRWPFHVILAPLLAFAACASMSDTVNAAPPRSVKLNQSFTLKIGALAIIEGENVEIGFQSVESDSRCPKGAQCITAGDATIRIWLARTSQPRELRDLKTSPPDAAQVVIDRYRITLNSLQPQPTVDRTPRESEYVATLTVARRP